MRSLCFGHDKAKCLAGALLAMLVTSCGCDEEITTATPKLTLWPDEISFESVTVGSHAAEEIAIRSDGGVPLSIEEIAIVDPAGVFSLHSAPAMGSRLAPGSVETMTVVFSPTEEGVFEAELFVRSNDEVSPHVLSLHGVAFEPAIELCRVLEGEGELEIDCLSRGENLVLDLGEAAVGGLITKNFFIRNVGRGGLEVKSVVVDDAAASGGISMVDLSIPGRVPTGAGFRVGLELLGSGQGPVAGRTRIVSNDPAFETVYVELLGLGLPNTPPLACAGATRRIGIDGAMSDLNAVEAVVSARPWDRVYLTAHPVENCSLDAEDGTELSYEWTVVEVPEGEGAKIWNDRSGPSPNASPPQPAPNVGIEGVGVYVVELVVYDSHMARSAPARLTIDARPDDELLVELSWGEPVDLDLHLIAPGHDPLDERVYCEPLDCFWHTCRPSSPGVPALHWGSVAGEIGDDGDGRTDPILRFDNLGDTIQPGTESLRLEVISLSAVPALEPSLGPYLIGVGYFDARNTSTEVEATVTVTSRGQVLFRSSRIFDPQEEGTFWIAGTYEPSAGEGEAAAGPVLQGVIYGGQPVQCR